MFLVSAVKEFQTIGAEKVKGRSIKFVFDNFLSRSKEEEDRSWRCGT